MQTTNKRRLARADVMTAIDDLSRLSDEELVDGICAGLDQLVTKLGGEIRTAGGGIVDDRAPLRRFYAALDAVYATPGLPKGGDHAGRKATVSNKNLPSKGP